MRASTWGRFATQWKLRGASFLCNFNGLDRVCDLIRESLRCVSLFLAPRVAELFIGGCRKKFKDSSTAASSSCQT